MTLRIRHLRLRVETAEGPFGAEVSVPDGLTVLHADNSHGKSTCLQGIVFALGLEGMFGPSREVPLPHAMTSHLRAGEREILVESADVYLEVENASGARITMRRSSAGGRAKDLITVWPGAHLSGEENRQSRDYYVRVPGSATAASGFHAMLAEFLGWKLPSVPTFAGAEVPLYVEIIFPLLYVEQKKGWGAIEGRFPSHLRIREPGTRAVEFLLGLETHALAERRANLSLASTVVRQRWTAVVEQLYALCRRDNLVLENVPRSPIALWPPRPRPALKVHMGEQWVDLDGYLEALDVRGHQIATLEAAPVAALSSQLQTELADAEREVRRGEQQAGTVLADLEASRSELRQLHHRLDAIAEDMERNQDAMRLQRVGALAELRIAKETCPTCRQHISDVMVAGSQVDGFTAMSLEQNIAYLIEQRKLFEFMLASAGTAVDVGERALAEVREQVDRQRTKVRALRLSLVSDDRLPAASVVAEGIQNAEQMRKLRNAKAEIEDELNGFIELAEKWKEIQEELKRVPKERFSNEDRAKLADFERLFVEQLEAYRLESLANPADLSISKDSLRPSYGDFDLQFDLSASDTIRAAWAYRIALLEVARRRRTNHPGLMMFDEPRQQETSTESLRAFFARLSTTKGAAQQAIVAISGERSALRTLVDGLECTLIEFDDRILSRLP